MAGELPHYNLVSEIACRLRSAQYLQEHAILADNRKPSKPVVVSSGRRAIRSKTAPRS